ncbi:MAG: RHS repeat domain-containing protein, partial [Xanthobacteraceae bacterium]
DDLVALIQHLHLPHDPDRPCPTPHAANPIHAETYGYDAHGNMTVMPHLTFIEWDFADELKATSRQAITTGVPETTSYVYDANGERVRKVTDRQAAQGAEPLRKCERLYLGAVEIYREFATDGATVVLERETLHVRDGEKRIALVETRSQGNDGSPAQAIRYQLSNHLGSAVLELDEAAQIVSYEEYFPYGSTSYQAVRSQTETPKRYRYSGKERDEESGFYYYGARYYASWIGRWTRADPAGLADGPNLYASFKGNPIAFVDSSGLASKPPKKPTPEEKLEQLKKEVAASPKPSQQGDIERQVEEEQENLERLRGELEGVRKEAKEAAGGEEPVFASAKEKELESQIEAKEELTGTSWEPAPPAPEPGTHTEEQLEAGTAEVEQSLDTPPDALAPPHTEEELAEAAQTLDTPPDDEGASLDLNFIIPLRLVRALVKEARKDSPVVAKVAPTMPLDPHSDPIDLLTDIYEWAAPKVGLPYYPPKAKSVANAPAMVGWGEREEPEDETAFHPMRLGRP